jgi:hypothetical protein
MSPELAQVLTLQEVRKTFQKKKLRQRSSANVRCF